MGTVSKAAAIIHRLCGALAPAEEVSDAELLERYVRGRDGAAFELLVWRHMNSVLTICKNIVRDHHVAEDMAQAVFLIFARKAGTIRSRASLVGWLHQTAYRESVRETQRRKRRGICSSDFLNSVPAKAESPQEVPPVLIHQAICRLPECNRVPILLCYFEGLSHSEAARRLDLPLGTFKTRIERGKELLARDLKRRGVAAFSFPLVVVMGNAEFLRATTTAALAFASGASSIEGVSPQTLTFARGGLRAMTMTKLQWYAAIAACFLGISGAAVSAGSALPRTPDQLRTQTVLAPAPKNQAANDLLKRVRVEKYLTALANPEIRKEIGCTKEQEEKLKELTQKYFPGMNGEGNNGTDPAVDAPVPGTETTPPVPATPPATAPIKPRILPPQNNGFQNDPTQPAQPPQPPVAPPAKPVPVPRPPIRLPALENNGPVLPPIARPVNPAIEFNKEAVKVIGPDQLKRLKQLILQIEGPKLFTQMKYGTYLKLTERQVDAIEETIEVLTPEMMEGEDGDEQPAGVPTTEQTVLAKVLKVLEPEQRTAWNELVGAPLEAQQLLRFRGVLQGGMFMPEIQVFPGIRVVPGGMGGALPGVVPGAVPGGVKPDGVPDQE